MRARALEGRRYGCWFSWSDTVSVALTFKGLNCFLSLPRLCFAAVAAALHLGLLPSGAAEAG